MERFHEARLEDYLKSEGVQASTQLVELLRQKNGVRWNDYYQNNWFNYDPVKNFKALCILHGERITNLIALSEEEKEAFIEKYGSKELRVHMEKVYIYQGEKNSTIKGVIGSADSKNSVSHNVKIENTPLEGYFNPELKASCGCEDFHYNCKEKNEYCKHLVALQLGVKAGVRFLNEFLKADDATEEVVVKNNVDKLPAMTLYHLLEKPYTYNPERINNPVFYEVNGYIAKRLTEGIAAKKINQEVALKYGGMIYNTDLLWKLVNVETPFTRF